MSDRSRIKIEKIERSVQGNDVKFLKIDRAIVSQRANIKDNWSPPKNWEILERGDAAAVLLFNTDNDTMILTRQFRAPLINRVEKTQDEKGIWKCKTSDLFLDELVAGDIRKDEGANPKATIIRETMEEVGYELKLEEIVELGWYYPSPGASSERIYLFYAEVSRANKTGKGGGVKTSGEFIHTIHFPVGEFIDKLEKREIYDSKILTAMAWLPEEKKALFRYKRDRDAEHIRETGLLYKVNPKQNSPETNSYIRLRKGSLEEVKDVSLWVNSENSLMEMNQFVGRSISSAIRSLGSLMSENGDLLIDHVGDALRKVAYFKGEAKIGEVYETQSGELWSTHNVRSIYHVASVKGRVGEPVKVKPGDIRKAVTGVLEKVERHNKSKINGFLRLLLGWWWPKNKFGRQLWRKHEKILIPVFGTGNAQARFSLAFKIITESAINFVQQHPDSSLCEINIIVHVHKDDKGDEDKGQLLNFNLARYCMDENSRLIAEPRSRQDKR